MIRFPEMITVKMVELHLEHIEDEILNFGVDGGDTQLSAFTTDMLSGGAGSSVSMTVKWDGALQSLQVLTHQMVSSLLQKNQYLINPKLYKSDAEIDRLDYTKLKV